MAKPHSVAIVQLPRPTTPLPTTVEAEEGDATVERGVAAVVVERGGEEEVVPVGEVAFHSSLSTTITARCGGDRVVPHPVVSSPSFSIPIAKADPGIGDEEEAEEPCMEGEDMTEDDDDVVPAVVAVVGDEKPPWAC